MNTKIKNKRGFTLIELLVVIAIIAILAAILFPVFAMAKKRTRLTTCTDNMKQLANAVFMYCNDHDGKVPRVCTLLGANAKENWANYNIPYRSFRPPRTTEYNATYIDLRRYVRNDKVYLCPEICDGETTPVQKGSMPYEISYNFNLNMNNFDTDKGPYGTKYLGACLHPNKYYLVGERHSKHHFERDKDFSRDKVNGENSPKWIMPMVMADGHVALNVHPYDKAWKDPSGSYKYDHWDVP